MAILDPSQELFDRGQWSHDGAQWRKQPFAIGYTDRLMIRDSVELVADGDYTMTLGAVPKGEVWTVGLFAARNLGSMCQIELEVYIAPLQFPLSGREGFGAERLVVSPVRSLVLKEGDVLRVQFSFCREGDEVQGFVLGQKMKVE